MGKSSHGLSPTYKIWINAKAFTSRAAMSTIATEISTDHICIITNKPILPKTMVNLSFGFKDEVRLQGNVGWVLDTQTDDGKHFYLTGIETDYILNQNKKAIGLAEKSNLLEDILFEIKSHNLN